jgi:hypothetical protein
MGPFETFLRSTLRASRRVVGLPLVIERLTQLENKIDGSAEVLANAAELTKRLALTENKLDRVADELTRRGTNLLPWHACTYHVIMGYPRVPDAVPARLPLRSGLCR